MLNWEDIRLFLAVARAGGLVGAKTTTQLSAPTLGRRILALEHELGVTLFDRHRLGYDLTTAGQELFERSIALEQSASSIERWRTTIDPQPVVKIAAGAWTSSFISQHLQELQSPKSSIRIEIMTGIDILNIARRETSLGIRNKRPHQTGLASRKIGQVEFAIYGSPGYIRANPDAQTEARFEACNWVTQSPQSGKVPSLAWLEQRMPRPGHIVCSSPHTILDAATNDAGLCILPCFIGEQTLTRVSETIDELLSNRWLVSHDDDRHNQPIKTISNRLAKLFREIPPCGNQQSSTQ